MRMTSMISKPRFAKDRVLILGATGKLGHILRVCWPEPDDLVLHSRRPADGFVAFDPLEIPAEMIKVLQGVRAVICLSGVTPAQAKGDLNFNIDLGVAAVVLGKAVGAKQVFCASTAAVYGRGAGLLSEAIACTPISPYGTAKLAMENEALAAAVRAGQAACMLRIGNVAGADAILGGWHAQMALDRFADGATPSRSYIGPQKLASVMYQLSRANDLPNVLNVAAPGGVEMGHLLDAADLQWTPRPAPETAIPKVALSTEQLEQYVQFGEEDCTAAGLVADWHSWKALEQTSS